MKESKIVWYDETHARIPEMEIWSGECFDENDINPDQLIIRFSKGKPKQNAKRIRITIEEVKRVK